MPARKAPRKTLGKKLRQKLRAIAFAIAAIAFVGLVWARSKVSPVPVVSPTSQFVTAEVADSLKERWVVSAREARALVELGGTLLDARPKQQRRRYPLPGSHTVSWRDFSQAQAPHYGKLLEDDRVLSEKLQAIGIDADRAAIVVGDPIEGWGEEGRIVWMLRSLGHERAVFVDGGYAALAAAGLPETQRQQGTFAVDRRSEAPVATIDRQQLAEDLSDLVIVDARTRDEFEGATPYGEKFGGRVPGAVHLHYRDLLAPDGRLLPREEIETLLAERGIDRHSEVVAYCTGGVRSAWFVAVLADMGYAARNYPGSMWEWSATGGALEKGRSP